jgi:hypothetical protein
MAVKRRFYKEKHRGRRAKSSVTSPLLRLPLSLSSNSSCSRAAAAAPFFNGRGGVKPIKNSGTHSQSQHPPVTTPPLLLPRLCPPVSSSLLRFPGGRPWRKQGSRSCSPSCGVPARGRSWSCLRRTRGCFTSSRVTSSR